MLAVKAKYDNGMVQWPNTPPVNGLHELIVIFQDIPEPVTEVVRSSGMSQASELDQAIAISQSLYSDIPQSVSLADELIAERRREALNE